MSGGEREIIQLDCDVVSVLRYDPRLDFPFELHPYPLCNYIINPIQQSNYATVLSRFMSSIFITTFPSIINFISMGVFNKLWDSFIVTVSIFFNAVSLQIYIYIHLYIYM